MDESIHSNSDGNLTREEPGWPHLNPVDNLPSLKAGEAHCFSIQSTTYEEFLSRVEPALDQASRANFHFIYRN